MRIALGSDHRGVETVRVLAAHLRQAGHLTIMHARSGGEPCDYPEPAWLVGQDVACGRADRGVLVCGSGIGISIAANKVPGVRAALVCDPESAEMSRRHNDANVLCLSGSRLSAEEAIPLVDVFLAAPFEGGRHARRVAQIMGMEQGEPPRTPVE